MSLLASTRRGLFRSYPKISSNTFPRGFSSYSFGSAPLTKNVPSILSGRISVPASFRSSLIGETRFTSFSLGLSSQIRHYSTPNPAPAVAPAAAPVPPLEAPVIPTPSFDTEAVLCALEEAAGMPVGGPAAAVPQADLVAAIAEPAVVEPSWYDFAVRGLQWVHETSGLPWWATIVSTVVVLRVLVLPLQVLVMRNSALMSHLQPKMEEITKKITAAKERGDQQELARLSNSIFALWGEAGTSPFKSLKYMLIQMPIWVLLFFSLKKLALIDPAMAYEGTLWFHNLTVPDDYYRLPILSASGMLLSMALGAEGGPPQAQKMKLFMVAMTPFIVWGTGSFPQGVLLYWALASYLGLGTMLLLKMAPIRRLLRIPETLKPTAQAGENTMEYFKKNILKLKADLQAAPVASAAKPPTAAAASVPTKSVEPVSAWPDKISKRKQAEAHGKHSDKTKPKA
eukprot:TRINITY_DN8329_c0_g1_i1.p1 TRINITY_DN8329_c0_g1~~TRINITY_DN8329_c0_g1_i1.p1  ORF type:complete len:455 (-),score=92.33 TRINITY_DN8329_c0_g1_i1:146-1510(-)